MQPITLEDGTSLDPGVVKVMKAIRHVESGGDFNATGDNGNSHGAYQWNKSHYQDQAKSFGLDPNDFSPGAQNKVAYKKIEAYKKQGFQPEEIAALWNGAKKNEDTGNYTYINPEYGRKFRSALQQQNPQQQQGFNPNPFSSGAVNFSGVDNTGPTRSLGNDLSGRVNDAGNAVMNTINGKINPLSGVLQTAGAAAGGVNDIIGAGIGLIPGAKAVEGAVGQGVNALAQTGPGQQVVQGVQKFSQDHPEISKDITSAANIGGLVGGGFAGGAAKNIAKEGVSSALSKGFQTAAEGGLGKTVAGLADRSASKTSTKLLETDPTKKEVAMAIKTGRVKDGAIIPDKLKTEEIKQVKGLVKQGKIGRKTASSDASTAIQDAGKAESERMRTAIRESDVHPLLQPEDLKALTDAVKKKAGESVVSGENPADKLMKVFTDNLPQGKDITAEDVLNARQKVSEYILDNKGDWSQTGVLTGFKNARNAFTDESRKLLVKLAPGVDIAPSLTKQSALYRAAERMAPAVKKELTNKAGKKGLVRGLAKGALHTAAEGLGIGGMLHVLGQ